MNSNKKIIITAIDQRSTVAIVFQTITIGLIMIGSAVGNIGILLAIYKTKSLQNKTSIFVANLAVADLLAGLLIMPFMFICSIIGDWPFEDASCNLTGTFALILGAAGMNTLGAIAYERYCAIVHSMVYHLKITNRLILIVITFIWLEGLVLSLCPILGWSEYIYYTNEYLCTVNWAHDVSFTYTIMVVMYFLPLGVMIFCYASIFKVARRHLRQLAMLDTLSPPSSHNQIVSDSDTQPRIENSARSLRLKRDIKAASMLFIVIGTFVLCWTLHGCTMMCLALGDTCPVDFPEYVYTMTTWIAMFNSVCNVWIYGMMNRQFRDAFRSLCCIACLRSSNTQVIQI
ncbi:G-protein coupled receptor 161-like [Amphiura filiformis]|uniref:G-protein coupled receptor 161-like n=1 Tax=Amphiura filiformis TaxID=82378 RepID=UPI003B220FCE